MTKYYIETSTKFDTEDEARAYGLLCKSQNSVNLHIHNHAETPDEENKPCEIIKLK